MPALVGPNACISVVWAGGLVPVLNFLSLRVFPNDVIKTCPIFAKTV